MHWWWCHRHGPLTNGGLRLMYGYFLNMYIKPLLFKFIMGISLYSFSICCSMIPSRSSYSPSKGTVFFYFPAKVHFGQLFGKNRVSVWKWCFFFQRCFFCPLFENEWVSELYTFPGKKIQNAFRIFLAKKTPPKFENCIFCLFFGTSTFFGEWVACKLLLEKKNNRVFSPKIGKNKP